MRPCRYVVYDDLDTLGYYRPGDYVFGVTRWNKHGFTAAQIQM